MQRLKVGYWPLSETLKSAGDRRRVVYWAKARNHRIITDLTEKVDVIIASENSDFNSSYFWNSKVPVVFDLVDAYLSPSNAFDDYSRGFAKWVTKHISGEIKPFSHHIRDFCVNSNAVICSSVEQEDLIKSYNTNTHVILDSHHEIPFIERSRNRNLKNNATSILWEGQPATIGGMKTILPALSKLQTTAQINLNFITDQSYYLLLNKYIKRSTISLLNRDLGSLMDHASIVPWSPDHLVEYAKSSSIAMIPIDLTIPIQRLKPENRLLIMWRLGLPCLTSPSPAYTRVAEQAGVSAICKTMDDWFTNANRLINDSEFAHKDVVAGQNYLRKYHNESVLLSKWDTAIESVL
jgi:hypothetical protein